MDIVEVVCIAVLIGLAVGAAAGVFVGKRPRIERESHPFDEPLSTRDDEQYPRRYE